MAAERLDKLLSSTGQWSRREVKDLVRQGRVTVDGRAALRPEEKADPASCCVRVDGQAVVLEPFVYVMMNKPAGLLSATEDRRQQTVLDLLPEHLRRRGLFPVGRLDKDTTGLLLLTDDGDLTHKLTHPSHEVRKEYHVQVTGDVAAALPVLSKPMVVDGEDMVADEVEPLGHQKLKIVIHQGKNRQVRRMCAAAGVTVTRLVRVREGNLRLGNLKRGTWRTLTAGEMQELFHEICK